MKKITAVEAKPGQKVRFIKHEQTVTAEVVSSRLSGSKVMLELACDKENIRKLTADERSAPTVKDWFESFAPSHHMALVD